MNERITRQLRKARKLGDRAAVAILEGGRTFADVEVARAETCSRCGGHKNYGTPWCAGCASLDVRRVAPETELEKLAGWAR